MKSLGQIAFEAYSMSTGGRTYDDKPIPPWFELSTKIQRAWEDAAEAVVKIGKEE